MKEGHNAIRLIGSIADLPRFDHSILGENMYKLTAAVPRLSGTEDLLPVTVSERLLNEIPCEMLDTGRKLWIEGQIRSYNHREELKSHLTITVFAREICPPEEDGEEPYTNEVELAGRIVKPVIYRTTPFMREIADLLVAVDRRYGKVDRLPCIAWGRSARFASQLSTGDNVLIRGRLQSRCYHKQNESGELEERTAYEISCSSIMLW